MTLPPALPGERLHFDGLHCYTAGSGPPLLLVHSINAAASAAEVRPLYTHWQRSRSVYALELPGYGFSDRSDRRYTPRLMTDALHAAVRQIRARSGNSAGAGGVDALAVSLSCEYLARAAVEQPAQFGRLALVSPTGFNGHKPRHGAAGSSREVPGLYKVLSAPLWSEALFRGLTRPGVIRYFLERTWGGKGIDEEMFRYCIQTTRQPGARFAPLHFLSAGLFSADIHTLYQALQQPVWVSHGVRGDFTDYRALPAVTSGRPNWQTTVLQTGAMPYFEQPAQFFAAAARHFVGG